MKKIADLLLFFIFCTGFNNTRSEESTTSNSMFQPKGRMMNRRMHKMVCASADYPLPISEGNDFMLDELCTDLLYKIPLHNKYSDWEYSLHYLDPLTLFRQRYPNIRLHISIPDFFLITTSTTEMAHLVAYLVKMQAASLDVIVDPATNLGILYHVLLSFRDILPPGKQLSISVSHLVSPHALHEQGIIETVDKIHAFPPHPITEPIFPDERKRGSSLMDLGEFTRHFSYARIPAHKLVIGVPSAHISVTPSTDLSTIPTMANICDGLEIVSWSPRRIGEDQLFWRNPKKAWSFRMLMGSSITDQIWRVPSRDFSFMIFDVPLNQPANPICSWHKDHFAKAVHQAITSGPRPQLDEPRVEEFSIVPQWNSIGDSYGGGRLGHILVYASPGEQEVFTSYFNIIDDNSLLASPIEHIVLGYNSAGEIYDIYQDSCNEESPLSKHLEYLVERYSLKTVISEAHIYGSLLPPSILIFPGASNTSARNFLHPTPVLITWFQKRSTYPAQWTEDGEYRSWMGGYYYGQSTPRPWYSNQHFYTQAPRDHRRPDPNVSMFSSSALDFIFTKPLFAERCPHRLLTKLPKKLSKYFDEATNSSTEFNETSSMYDATLDFPPTDDAFITDTRYENENSSTTNHSSSSDFDEYNSTSVPNDSSINFQEIPKTFDDISVESPPSIPSIILENVYQTTSHPTYPPFKVQDGTTQQRGIPQTVFTIRTTTAIPNRSTKSENSWFTFPSINSYIPSFESVTKAFEEAYSKIRNKFAELG